MGDPGSELDLAVSDQEGDPALSTCFLEGLSTPNIVMGPGAAAYPFFSTRGQKKKNKNNSARTPAGSFGL